jgi:hypothetical protein
MKGKTMIAVEFAMLIGCLGVLVGVICLGVMSDW